MPEALRLAIRKFEGFERAIQRQWADFAETTGCSFELEFESLDLNPLVDALFTRQGLRNGDFDIAFIVTDWIADAVASGALLDLAPFMQERTVDGYPEAWPASLTRFQEIDGAIDGLPYHDGPECLIYRKDIFDDPHHQQKYRERTGEPLEPPTTWEQFESIARFFTHPENDEYGTLFAAFPDGHNTVYDFCIQLWSRGGELHDAQGRPTIATQPAIEGLDFYRRLLNDRSVTPPGLEKVDSVKSGELFTSGKIAMMVNWFGFAALCEQPDSPLRGKVGIAPVPAAGEAESASLNVYWVLGVGSGSRHAAAAYDFIRHCCAPAMDRITSLEGGIGCRKSTWHDPEINDLIPFYSQLDLLHQNARELPRSRQLPALIHIIDRAVHRAIATGDPTETILREAQAEADGIRL
ncbi:MAG: extracellular solute-binding protein [Thermomicrobiales bacterium]|nr:extracellular solute-binding protein [Thermomicrobiales bacterium]